MSIVYCSLMLIVTLFGSIFHEEASFGKEKFEKFVIFAAVEYLGYYFLLVFMWLCVIFSKSWLQWNRRGEKYVSWPSRMCIMFSIYFFHFLWRGHNGFCVSSWKAQGYEHFPGTFYWEIPDKKKKKKAGLLRAACATWWRVSVICRELQNNDGNKGITQVAFNKMPLSTQGILLTSQFKLPGLSMQPEKS